MGLKDNGKRTEFDTGAKREILPHNGRCDLIYNTVFGELWGDAIPQLIEKFIRTGDRDYILSALHEFIKIAYTDTYTAYLEVAQHYAEGAVKYAPRNMEKGLPFHCCIDSGMRHYAKYRRGDKDEPHDRAFIWNMITLLYMVDNKPELNDLPYGEKGEE